MERVALGEGDPEASVIETKSRCFDDPALALLVLPGDSPHGRVGSSG